MTSNSKCFLFHGLAPRASGKDVRWSFSVRAVALGLRKHDILEASGPRQSETPLLASEGSRLRANLDFFDSDNTPGSRTDSPSSLLSE